MRLKCQISSEGNLILTDNQQAYLKKHAGKQCFVYPDERSTTEKIAFLEGPVAKFFYLQHRPGAYGDLKDVRYTFKEIAHHTEFRINEKGQQIEVPRSMSEIYESNTKTAEFIEKIQDYFLRNAYDFPDSSHWKDWRDTGGPDKGEYPPLIELKKEYDKQIKEDLPSWRK